MKLSNTVKILLLLIFLAATVTGFMIKLPATFSHHDKQAHAGFYFLAAAFLNILFATRNLLWHVFIFVVLYVFGMSIELAQEYSNKLLHKKIHGRYDVEDVQANLKGLLLFSMVWLVFSAIAFLYRKLKNSKN